MDQIATLEARLEAVEARFSEIEARLTAISGSYDQQESTKLSKERASLEPVVSAFHDWRAVRAQLSDAEGMARDSDPEIAEMARSETQTLRARSSELADRIKVMLVPKDPNDDKDIFVEIRGGTGGDEASLFAGDLMRMYAKFAEKRRLKVELVSTAETQAGGFKEVILGIKGTGS